MARKHRSPQRTCIACRATNDKRQLIRVVRTPEGTVKIDPSGKANGRGAYLCQQASCWEKSLQRKTLGHALKVNISKEDTAALQHYLETELSRT